MDPPFDLPLGCKTQNDVLRMQNAEHTRTESALKKQNASLKNDLFNIKNQSERLKSSAQEIQDLKIKIFTSKAESDVRQRAKDKEIQDLRTELDKVKGELGRSKSSPKEVEGLKIELSNVKGELQRLKVAAGKKCRELREELSDVKEELESLKAFRPAQSTPFPAKEPPPPLKPNGPPSPGEKRKEPPCETDDAHTKRARFGAPGGTSSPFSASPPPPPPTEPFGGLPKGFKATPFPKASPFSKPPPFPQFPKTSTPGFGAFGAGGASGFGGGGAGAPPLGSFGSGAKMESSQSGFMGAKPGILPFFARCTAWKNSAEEFFARAKKTGSMKEENFPEPPDEKCTELGCKEKNSGRALKACEHLVAKVLKEVMGSMEKAEMKRKFLEEQRRMWHPDMGRRFAGKDIEMAERLVGKFGEVSRCVGELLEPLLGKGEWKADEKPKSREL